APDIVVAGGDAERRRRTCDALQAREARPEVRRAPGGLAAGWVRRGEDALVAVDGDAQRHAGTGHAEVLAVAGALEGGARPGWCRRAGVGRGDDLAAVARDAQRGRRAADAAEAPPTREVGVRSDVLDTPCTAPAGGVGRGRDVGSGDHDAQTRRRAADRSEVARRAR